MTSDDMYRIGINFTISWGFIIKVLYFPRIPQDPLLCRIPAKLSDPTLGDYTGPLNIVLQFSFFKGDGPICARASADDISIGRPPIPSGGRCREFSPAAENGRPWVAFSQPLLDYRLL
ncbi:hypothetical protein CEXT_145831 [Caerostris extrusa]|uniref:Uncharacterized protein n=1 Tax=Caerostris extrusa TaxID=172846 RepID=A0AAV4WB47_CAEEX|nr:hypothetical protein CEXT_145831 [Caerostris extrusa]